MNPPILIVPIDNRIELLPFHIKYYARLGFRQFVYALWNGDGNPLRQRIVSEFNAFNASELNERMGMAIRPSICCTYNQYNGPAEKDGLNKIREEFCGPEDWYCVADLDEFVWFGENGANGVSDQQNNIEIVIGSLKARDYDAMHGLFHDRVAADGSFPPLPKFGEATLDDTYPTDVYLTRNATGDREGKLPANINKITLAKGKCSIYGGHHRTDDGLKVLENACEVHHFKWHAGVIELLARRWIAYSSQHLDWARESLSLLEMFGNPDWIKDERFRAKPSVKLGV